MLNSQNAIGRRFEVGLDLAVALLVQLSWSAGSRLGYTVTLDQA